MSYKEINQKKAYIFALLAAICWSTVATAFKLALEHFSPAGLLFIAVATSFIFLALSMLFKKSEPIDLSIKTLIRSAALGFLNPFLYYIILFKAYSLLPAQTALTLNYTWAIVVVLLSIPLLKQKIKLLDIVSLLISFCGAFVIVTKGNILSLELSNPYGVGLALISSLVWAIFWIYNVRDKRDELTKLFLNFAFGIIYITIYMAINGEFASFFRSLSLISATSGVYVGLFEMGITFIFWLKAMQYSKTTAGISNIIYISPFLSLIIITIVLGESIHYSSIIGLSMIIAGITFRQIKI